ncbi:aminodeoxychorismate/anthranilate synthase component II [bacterium]|nr:MAG: aminodeoxychorismate/anthranilate synthase component II [bacterium]RKZ15531.1 MAG: aminodeoxychorismate/anthranilate synthase component II [bacterium]
MTVLLIDNYDSFTWNLAQLLGGLGATVEVQRNDALDVEAVRSRRPSHIVLSPGPGRPERERDFGVCGPVLDELAGQVPILGVCLGHQGIVQRLGGSIVQAPSIVHGKSEVLTHEQGGLFAGLPGQLEAMRYHSLIADRDSLPDCLRVTAETADGLIMAVSHREKPVFGLQFHPESIGTPRGELLLQNFLESE